MILSKRGNKSLSDIYGIDCNQQSECFPNVSPVELHWISILGSFEKIPVLNPTATNYVRIGSDSGKANCTVFKRIPGDLKVWPGWSATDGRGGFIANFPLNSVNTGPIHLCFCPQSIHPVVPHLFPSLTGSFQFYLGRQASFFLHGAFPLYHPIYTMALLADYFCTGI